MFRCTNPACLALHEADPRGHCPICRGADGSGWSCVTDYGFTCPKCGASWPAGRKALKCVTCGSVHCASCKDVPSVHTFQCFAEGRR